MTLEYIFRANNVEITEENFDTSVAFNLTAGTFEGDTSYDYCTLFEPTASEFEAAGKGYVVAAVGEASGEIPYTAFSAKKSYIDEKPERIEAFLRAVVKGYKFLRDNSEDVVAEALAPQFPGTSLEFIAASITRYLEIDAWSTTPVMSKEAFERLQDVMESAGELDTRADYSVAVYNDIAKKVTL